MESEREARRTRRTAREIMQPVAPPRRSLAEEHESLWEVIAGVRERLASLEGKVSVILLLVAATAIAAFGQLILGHFAR